MTKVVFVNDSGTSEQKGALVVLQKGIHEQNIVYEEFPTLGAPGQGLSALPSPQLSILLEPKVYRGAYKAQATAFGATLHRDSDIYALPVYKLYNFGMLAELLAKAGITDQDILVEYAVFGFPVKHKQAQAALLRDLLHNDGNPWTLQKEGGIQYSVRFQEVICETQPYYMAIDQIFAWQNGFLSHERGKQLFEHGPVLFYDFGSNSSDIEWVPMSLLESESRCVMKGTFNFLSELESLAYAKTHQEITQYDLVYHVLKHRSLTLPNGVTYDFRKEIPQLFVTAAQSAKEDVSLLISELGDRPRPYTMYLGGGGAMYGKAAFIDAFTGKFFGGVHVVYDDQGNEEPVYSIRRGMVKKAIIEYSQKG